MSRSQVPYHKGNLREKLLKEAARLIAREGVSALSMRKLSDRLGISRMAAYHHFADKDALLAAVGQDGFRRLVLRLRAAAAAEASAGARLRATLLAYVHFATAEAEFFRLMFADLLDRPFPGGPDFGLSPYSFSSPEAREAFGALLSAVKACQDEGTLGAGDPLWLANALWALTHGVAWLTIGQNLKTSEPLDTFFERSLAALIAGLTPAG